MQAIDGPEADRAYKQTMRRMKVASGPLTVGTTVGPQSRMNRVMPTCPDLERTSEVIISKVFALFLLAFGDFLA